ncbi:YihY/virulence factor BrkB family protein [Ramlibacter sp. MAHUQ-53]|uniref:YihY/virulence factor BrkB family protein n=1 Tax=unclassified Ramlibacter TaxID=2617605 RepID=UPI0036272F90
MGRARHGLRLLLQAGRTWIDEDAPAMGAAIAYYTVFSLAPLLVIVIAIAGALFGREAVQGQVVAEISGLLGAEGARLVQDLLASASDTGHGLAAGAASAGVLVVGATTVFAQLQSSLDRIWHVPARARPSGLWALLRARLVSFGLVLGVAFLLMASLAVSAALAALGAWAGGLAPGWEPVLQALHLATSLAVFTTLFAMIYKLLPSTPIAWRDVWVGALVTALLFEAGKLAIGLYLGKSGITRAFAAAGSLVVVLLWVYFAAQVFLFGAAFTRAQAEDRLGAAAREST